VISPLIALMKDQVENLRKKGIQALTIVAGMHPADVRKTLHNAVHGNYRFLYVSPERLQTDLFREYIEAIPVNLIAVDEAHCISQWGYDFRPSYLQIAEIRIQLRGVPVLALTASAIKPVQDDICEKLGFSKEQARFQQSFERPNLSYSVFSTPDRQRKLLDILGKVDGSAIVYCRSRRQTAEIAELLGLHRFKAGCYHAGLDSKIRSSVQEEWISNRIRIMVATNAFGMGIDKPDVRLVVHYGLPDCIENYYQEAGRAGRDGQRAYAVLLYSEKEMGQLAAQPDIRFPDKARIRHVYTALMNHLQVPAGSGADCQYPFDLAAFCLGFKLDATEATYCIKSLEQENLLSYSESLFQPARLLLTAGRSDLEELEKNFPTLDYLVKALLRSYAGITEFPAAIQESKLALFTAEPPDKIKADLQTLHRMGWAEYTPQKECPQLTLHRNRMYADSFRIDLSGQQLRKSKFQLRINALMAYVQEKEVCRSVFIATYFNDATTRPCGICDNCLNQRKATPGSPEFGRIAAALLGKIGNGGMKMQQLLKLEDASKDDCWLVFEYLLAEKKIRVDEKGMVERITG
jgi:ATP-dependent DNA helicase RecQ